MKTLKTIFISILLLFTLGCGDENTVPVATKAPIVTATKSTTTRAPLTTNNAVTCSIGFEVRKQIHEWNKISAKILSSYMDMSIPVDQVVSDFENLNPQLTRVVSQMHSLEDCLPTHERSFFTPFLATYDDKLSGYSALENSMRIDSTELEKTALQMLTDANSASFGMICAIAEFLDEKLPGAELCINTVEATNE
tara:strand:+ start:122 stop:706 length:585 start_codon:yes stop_codon:yes gene_type:complete